MFEDHVHAALVGDAPNFFRNVLLRVIDHKIGAERAGFFKLRIRSGHRNDARAGVFGDLNGGAAHARPRADHEHVLAGLELSARKKHMPGGQENQRHRRGFVKTQIARNRDDVPLRRADVFRVAAVHHHAEERVAAASTVEPARASVAQATTDAWAQQDAVARFDLGHERADLVHLARDVAPDDVRHRELPASHAHAQPDIQVIQRRGLDAHQNFVSLNLWVRRVLVFQDLRPAMFVETDSFHNPWSPPES